MITSASCWLKAECKKFNNQNKPCECREADVFCIKLFKIATLYEQALMSESQRCRKVINLDSDRRDCDAFYALQRFSFLNQISLSLLKYNQSYIL